MTQILKAKSVTECKRPYSETGGGGGRCMGGRWRGEGGGEWEGGWIGGSGAGIVNSVYQLLTSTTPG